MKNQNSLSESQFLILSSAKFLKYNFEDLQKIYHAKDNPPWEIAAAWRNACGDRDVFSRIKEGYGPLTKEQLQCIDEIMNTSWDMRSESGIQECMALLDKMAQTVENPL